MWRAAGPRAPLTDNTLRPHLLALQCYFSAGSWESWRPDANSSAWETIKIGKMSGAKEQHHAPNENYALCLPNVCANFRVHSSGWDELWLDIRQLTPLSTVMGARMDLAVKSGCDGVEPDNTDVRAPRLR